MICPTPDCGHELNEGMWVWSRAEVRQLATKQALGLQYSAVDTMEIGATIECFCPACGESVDCSVEDDDDTVSRRSDS